MRIDLQMRRLLACTLAVVFMTLHPLLGGLPSQARVARAQTSFNPIILENQNTGSDGWQIGRGGGFFTTNDTRREILGYGDAYNVAQGGEIRFHVTVTPTQQFSIDIYRMGWYQGKGGRLMLKVGPLDGITQPDCPQDTATGMTECLWTPSYTLTVPNNWTSGYYIAVLTNRFKIQSTITFIVRDSRAAAIHYQAPEYTYAAYSNFPRNGATGKALYEYLSFGANTIAGTTRAVKVSLDRPMKDSSFGGAFYNSGGVLNVVEPYWEIYLVRWLERNGYDVTYSSQSETQTNPARLRDAKVVISPAHDEYWTAEMRDAFEAARDAGVNLLFLGSNHAYWQGRLEPASDGRPNRVLTVYKDAVIDPEPDPLKKTVLFRSPEVSRPEQSLIGIQYRGRSELFSNTTYSIIDPGVSEIFSGTGFVAGSAVPGIVGHEVDQLYASFPLPLNTSYTLLTTSTYTTTVGQVINAHTSIYRAPSGAWVFAAGTMSWSWGLDRPGYVNSGIQKTTENVLALMGVAKPELPPVERKVLLPFVAK